MQSQMQNTKAKKRDCGKYLFFLISKHKIKVKLWRKYQREKNSKLKEK